MCPTPAREKLRLTSKQWTVARLNSPTDYLGHEILAATPADPSDTVSIAAPGLGPLGKVEAAAGE
jgi:hypothetical protein